VQYGTDKTPNTSRPDISGRVVFLGKAADNQRIQNIYAQIPGFNGGTAFRIARYESGLLVSDRTTFDTGNNAWTFNIIQDNSSLSLDYGHAVNWEFAWDSSTVSNTEAGLAVTFSVNDYRTGSPTAPSNELSVNVVPYISDVITNQPSQINRSSLGWYSVRESGTMTIQGFNMSGGTVSLSGTAVTGTIGSAQTIPAAAASGELIVTKDGVTSINNRNVDTVSYNKKPNVTINETLNDDIYVYVWNTATLVSNASGEIHNPFFRMDAAGSWYLSYGLGGKDAGINKNGTYTKLDQAYNRFLNTTVNFDSSGNYYVGASSLARGGDAYTSASSYNFYYRSVKTGNWADGNHAANADFKRRLELVYNTSVTPANYFPERVQVPRFAIVGAGTNANPAKIYMAYQDNNHSQSPVVFRYGTYNDAANGTATTGNLTGNFANLTATTESGNSGAGRQVIMTGNKDGLYTAVGGLGDGRAVVAWYDAVNRRLLLSTSNSDDPSTATTTAQWGNRQIVVDDDNAGWFVDMAVAPRPGVAATGTTGIDEIHLAYYTNGNGGLRYAYLEYDRNTNIVSNLQVRRVDTYLSAGTKLMINVRNESRTISGTARNVNVPYISYYHLSYPSTSHAVRVAWMNDFSHYTVFNTSNNPTTVVPGNLKDNTDTDDRFLGSWEVVTIPTPNTPVEDYICNGVPSGTLASQANYGNFGGILNNRNVILGYMAGSNYERAILKWAHTRGLGTK